MTWSCGQLELDMNERIRQLARDSYMVEVVCSQKSVKVNYPKNFEKFAELIVRECMKLNRDILCEDDPDYLDKVYKDHFGVEK
jgi:hypothetical protein